MTLKARVRAQEKRRVEWRYVKASVEEKQEREKDVGNANVSAKRSEWWREMLEVRPLAWGLLLLQHFVEREAHIYSWLSLQASPLAPHSYCPLTLHHHGGLPWH